MAHELATFIDGRARMAYVGDTPWHGLGQQLTKGAPLETWAKEAGMDFQIFGAPVLYKTDSGIKAQGSKQVLYRADTGDALGVVGNRYKVVQPLEVLEFFRDLVAEQGFELETAGVLFDGAKYWAMARTGQEFKIGKNDVLKDYLMLATACDGTLRTTARRTSVRVVCNNTLTLSNKDALNDIKVSHASVFDPRAVKSELGLREDDWDNFKVTAELLSETHLNDQAAINFVQKLYGEKNHTQISKTLQLYSGQGLGAEFKTSQGTAWGMLNAVTEVADWHQGKNQDRRLESAWLYAGNNLKQKAAQMLLDAANDPSVLLYA